jgi:hypothetical protein
MRDSIIVYELPFFNHREFPIVTADTKAHQAYFDGAKAIYSGF